MKKPQWPATALAIATAVLLGVSASDASALALGRITVQSAIGEPLRAEIDIPQINAEELASLRTGVASPEAFRAAGLEYNPSLSAIRITLERRPDGRHFLRLTSTRPVTDPFMDLILETQWSAGRIVRDYTMLFDPPNLRQSAPPPLAAQVAPVAPATRLSPSPAPVAPSARAAPAPRSAPAARPAAEPRTPAEPRVAGDGKQVTVQAGDTAGKIAAANKPANVSLDQMLVALLRANPDAFVGGNVNRLRSGAVLEMPGNENASLVPTAEARQTLVAQSRDFNEFRRRLAEGLPAARVEGADRQASGKVQAQVEEKKPGPATPDKLTLSKGAAEGKVAAEEKIARDRAAQDAAKRVAEINKNISDLNKLGTAGPAGAAAGATGAAGTASAARPGLALPLGTASAVKPGAPAVSLPPPTATTGASAAKAPTPSPVAQPATPPVAPPVVNPAATASARAPAPIPAAPVVAAAPSATPAPVLATPASAALASASAAPGSASPASATPVAKTPTTPGATKPAAPVETSLIDDMLENPLVPATLGAVLALLLGFGIYRAQQRKKSTQVDSSFLESRLQPDSFFGASGGQRIDTNEGGATGSSMVYSPSQLDAAGDVDPVAEADVYLAYGRDLQAEEILKEAMRTTPQRVAIHSKLLEIYSKRRDAKAFELVASEAYGLTSGQGPDWEHICELGQELDPSNALYKPGGRPAAGAAVAAAAGATAASFGATTVTPAMPTAAAPPASDLDLDLDFSVGDDEPSTATAPTASTGTESTQALPAVPDAAAVPSLDMDFGSATVALDSPQAPTTAPVRLDAPSPNLDEDALSFDLDSPPAAPAPAPISLAAAPAPAPEAGMIEFDMGALSLDLPGSAPASAKSDATGPDTDDAPLSTAGAPLSTGGFDDTGGGDPLATKLALAEEFNAIGDPDGARSLAQEVLSEASGDLKSRAQRFLAEIS